MRLILKNNGTTALKLFSALAFILCMPGILNAQRNAKPGFVTYHVDLKKQELKFYWRDEQQQIFRNFANLKTWLEKRNIYLEFAMNGGMYNEQNGPQGLYIENKQTLNPIDLRKGKGNFYLKPNGIFYISNDLQAGVCVSEKFKHGNVKYATQSGPMLLIDGKMHPAFKKGSKNLNIRNGVGIIDKQHIVFVMSKQEINFYDFADYFRSLGCKNALYLDGHISKTFLPAENLLQTDGNFGVIIAVVSNKKSK